MITLYIMYDYIVESTYSQAIYCDYIYASVQPYKVHVVTCITLRYITYNYYMSCND